MGTTSRRMFSVMSFSEECHLQWNEHINCLNVIITKCIANMHNLRDISTVNTMKQLYNSFIFPYIDYCLEAWGRTYPSNVNPVYVMQKKAIRIICNAHYNDHTNNYFIESNALKLFDLLKYKTCFFMYKANKNLLSKNIQNLFVYMYGQVHTRQTGNFQQSDVITTKEQMCITIRESKLWNSLETSLIEENNIHRSKKNIIKQL